MADSEELSAQIFFVGEQTEKLRKEIHAHGGSVVRLNDTIASLIEELRRVRQALEQRR